MCRLAWIALLGLLLSACGSDGTGDGGTGAVAFDPATLCLSGDCREKIQLPDDSPVIHGAKLINGYMYCCDDFGWIWRFKI